jgi:23S rRNA-/tRNA-specific pseudouridylate synthase
VIRFVVTGEVDRALSDVIAEMKQSYSAITEGRVFVGPRRARTHDDVVHPGDEVTVHPRTETVLGVEVLSEWRSLFAVYKPAGMASEPDKRGAVSLVQEGARLLQVDVRHLHCVTRLDAAVSGVAVLAWGRDANRLAAELQQKGALHRRYVALVQGAPVPSSGLWDVPIGTGKGGAAVAGGRDAREASTRYAVVHTRAAAANDAAPGARDALSVVVAEPVTGRTHQIRIHASHAGTPLLGDGAHGGPRQVVRSDGRVIPARRVALHALRVRIDGAASALRALAPCPPDFTALYTDLGGDPAILDPETLDQFVI